MGTGGSLRLLSPETKLSLDPVAAAFLVSPLANRTGSRLTYLNGATGFIRTLKTAQARVSALSDQDSASSLGNFFLRTPFLVSLRISPLTNHLA